MDERGCGEGEECEECNGEENEQVWMERLIRQVDAGAAPQWVKDALACNKIPREAVLVAYLKWDREKSTKVAYA